MEALVGVLTSLQDVFGFLTLAGAIYVGWDLYQKPDHQVVGLLARLWVFVLLGVIAVTQIVFASNAVMLAAYVLGMSLSVVQLIAMGSLAVAVAVWMSS